MKSKILLFDIENSPNISYTWGKWEQNVIDFQQEWYMLSFAYKWLGDKTVKSYSLSDFKGYKKDKTNDKALVIKLWELLDEADIVIGHNVKKFDIRKSNARFIVNGLNPPSTYRAFDTLTEARKHFFFNSNKLTDLGKHLNIGQKVETGGFELWLQCMNGDLKAWKKMVRYNKHDVTLLENVYLKLRGWSTNHPNRNVIEHKEEGCPICGSDKIQKQGFSYTNAGTYQRYKCTNCYAWLKSKKSLSNISQVKL